LLSFAASGTSIAVCMYVDARSRKVYALPLSQTILSAERLGGEEQHPPLPGEVRHREPDVGRVGAHEERHLIAREQFLCDAHGVAGRSAVVARHDLQRAPQHAAGRVDLVARELHALAIGLEERGKDLVAVELAETDRLRAGERGDCEREQEGKNHAADEHDGSSSA
jgi:hypothetical protein